MFTNQEKTRLTDLARQFNPVEHPQIPGFWLVTVSKNQANELRSAVLKRLRDHPSKRGPSKCRLVVTDSEINWLMRQSDRSMPNPPTDESFAVWESEPPEPSSIESDDVQSRRLGPTPRLTRKRVFRDHILRWVTDLGVSQREAAALAGIDMRLLQRWAKDGIAQPSLRTQGDLEKLKTAIGLDTVDDLWREWSSRNQLKTAEGVVAFLSATGQLAAALTTFARLYVEAFCEECDPLELEAVLVATINTHYKGPFGTLEEIDSLLEFLEVSPPIAFKAVIPSEQPKPSSDVGGKRPTQSNMVLIKWAGSKRRQASHIVEQFPPTIGTYWEPFIGSGAVLYRLLDAGIDVMRCECSDACEPLIGIWDLIQNNPDKLVSSYGEAWRELQTGGQATYNDVRDRFNDQFDPTDLFFLLRTCRLGFPQFNQKGGFVTPYHLGERGLDPNKVKLLLDDWHQKLQHRNVHFSVRDFEGVISQPGDFLYLDPPYQYTQSRLYLGKFDHERFYGWLAEQQASYALSMNSKAIVPEPLFQREIQIANGNSPILRLNKAKLPIILEKLYLRRHA